MEKAAIEIKHPELGFVDFLADYVLVIILRVRADDTACKRGVGG